MYFKRKALSLLLAIAMFISFMPALAFADDGKEETQEPVQMTEEQNDADVVKEQPAADAPTDDELTYEELSMDAAGKESAEDMPEEPATDISAASPAAPAAGVSLSAKLKQTKLNYRDVTVTVKDLKKIISGKKADTVKIVVSMSYKGTVTTKKTAKLKLSDFDSETNTAAFKVPYYGKYNVAVTFLKSGKTVGTTAKSTLGVAAEEYNIAPLFATTDPLIFSLKYFIDGSIKEQTEAGDPVPTIVMLHRGKQYDWNKLPSGMFRNPLLTEGQLTSSMKWDNIHGSDNAINRMVQYVKDLNSIHSGSKFNFYINDYHIYSFPRLSYANGLKDEQYTLTLITDGSATYASFKSAYEGVEDAQAVHDRLVSEYNEYKEKAKAGKISDYSSFPSGNHRIYAYAAVDAEDAQWWVVRKSTDTFGLTDKDFQAKVLADSRISNNYINNLLGTVQSAGRDGAFKALYNFDDSAFKATRARGNKIMMIIGTSKSVEDTYPVEDYVRFMMAEMGDKYEFYYKGHPGNFTADSKENTAKYNGMGIQMLDPSIAAELFLFYNDDIYLCGYDSSLYMNASSEKSEEQDISLFRRNFQTARVDGNLTSYADFMEFTICDLNNDKDPNTYAYDEVYDGKWPGMTDAKAEAIVIRDKVKAVVPEDELEDKIFLVEYNDKKESEYDYAIWNSSKARIHYIKVDEEGNLAIAASRDVKEVKTGQKVKVKGNEYKITSVIAKTVTFIKAKNAKAASVPATITIDNKKYSVTAIGAKAFTGKKITTVTVGANVKSIAKYAFKGSRAVKIVVKSKLLTKKTVHGSLSSSKIKAVIVKIGSKSVNKKYIKKYKAYFAKKNSGRTVTVR